MTRSPSLRRRTIAAGVLVVAFVLCCLDAFVYLNLQRELDDNLDALLQDRIELAGSLATDHGVDELASRLERAGIAATVVRRGEQVVADPSSPSLGTGPAESRYDGVDPAARSIELADGTVVSVFASRTGSEDVLEHTRFLLVLGTAFGVLLAALLLVRSSAIALRPLETLVDAANRIARGEAGVRLRPDRPETEIGKVGVAFDEVTEALESAVERANSSADANRMFLADAAHQLRTPITAMRAAAEVVGMDLDPGAERQAMELLTRQSIRVGELLTALLRLAQIDMGEPPRQEFVNLHELCRGEVERIAQLAPALRVELLSDASSKIPIELDPVWFRQAIANLLDNAIRHAKSRIIVWSTVHGQELELTVSDDGPGMADDEAEQVFGRFVSLDHHGGSGLGLPIARGIIEAHGGSLGYTDRRFVVRMRTERRHRPRWPEPAPQGAGARADERVAVADHPQG